MHKTFRWVTVVGIALMLLGCAADSEQTSACAKMCTVGCCDARGVCHIDETLACGYGGAGCTACPGGYGCQSGQCVATSQADGGSRDSGSADRGAFDVGNHDTIPAGDLPSSACGPCALCCAGPPLNACTPVPHWRACGNNGAACAPCADSQYCTVSGGCAEVAPARWLLTVLSVAVESTKANGEDWDSTVFTAPDIYLEVSPWNGQTVKTKTAGDTAFVNLDQLIGTYTTAELRSLLISVWDEDTGSREQIGSCQLVDLNKPESKKYVLNGVASADFPFGACSGRIVGITITLQGVP